MTNTNKAHDEAVQLVREKLEESGLFGKINTDGVPQGVDLQTTHNGNPCYFTVIKGREQKSKSTYSAVGANTWQFAMKHPHTLFFIAAIENMEGIFEFYCYTPTEMWERSNKPYVHLKCNPLKKSKRSLKTIEETFSTDIPSERYEGEKKMVINLGKLSNLLGKLQSI